MEGPSLALLAIELKNFIGQKIVDVFGNSKIDQKKLLNQKIKDIYSFGKKLIIQTNDNALTVHFLMYGSYSIHQPKNDKNARLAIVTEKDSLYLYNCSIKNFEDKNLRKKLNLFIDILSPEWDLKKVVILMNKNKKETIDDVLLNQDIFAGVGNIIKNEALFLSKVSPLEQVKDLTKKQLEEIALNTRMFSQNFFKWRKKFELKKNLKIYRKQNCIYCNTKIIRKKTGLRHRWSYFCPNCQKLF